MYSRPEVSDEEMRRIAEMFGAVIRGASVDLGGLPNVTFLAMAPGGNLAIRVCNEDYTLPTHVDLEVSVLLQLEKSACSISPRIVRGLDGQVQQQWRGHSVIATRYIAGTRLDSVKRSSRILEAVGLSVGQLSADLALYSDPVDSDHLLKIRTEKLFDQMDSIPERYRWPINAGWLRDVFETEYVRLHGRKSLCHTDVWPPNVILSNGVAFIIDFDDLALTDPILDLASCIAEFAIVESGIVIEDAARAIFTGYLQSGLILHDQQIQDLVAGVCCSYASWLAMDSCHSVEFQNSAHYLTRLKTLQDAPGRQLALAALSTALQKAIQHTSN